jgi:hypothetical protein
LATLVVALVVELVALVAVDPQSCAHEVLFSPYSHTLLPQVEGQSDVPMSDRTQPSADFHQTNPSDPAAWSITARVSPVLIVPTMSNSVPAPLRRLTARY